MKKVFRTYAFKGLVLWIVGGTLLVFHLTKGFESTSQTNAFSEVLVKDGNFEITLSKPIRYAPRQSELPISRELNEALTALADHLIEDPLKKLLVTGQYTMAEEQSSETKGLGKARSEYLKDLLVSFGADPSSIYTTSKLSKTIDPNSKYIKGVTFAIIDKDRKVNTSPLFEANMSKMVSQTGFLIPYYTRNFEKVDVITSEVTEFIERIVENPEMALVLSVNKNHSSAEALLDSLYAYISEMTYGIDIQIIKEFKDEPLSDSTKHNIRIDIGIKRFQNNSEFLGS